MGWGTVSRELEAGVEGEDFSRGVWLSAERRESINWRELKEFRMLLESQCGSRVADERVQHGRLQCDNMAVLYIVRGMVSSSKVFMKELRVLERLLRAMNVKVDTRRIPSTAKLHANSM